MESSFINCYLFSIISYCIILQVYYIVFNVVILRIVLQRIRKKNYTLSPQTPPCLLKLYLVSQKYTLSPHPTSCLPKLHLVSKIYTLSPQLYLVSKNYTLSPQATHCLPKLQLVSKNYTLSP